MSHRYRITGVALALCAVLASTFLASSASADGAGIQACGPELVYTYYTSDGQQAAWRRNCPGDYPLNSDGVRVYAPGWSGFVVFSDASTDTFCNGETRSLGGKRVKRIVMSADKARFCP